MPKTTGRALRNKKATMLRKKAKKTKMADSTSRIVSNKHVVKAAIEAAKAMSKDPAVIAAMVVVFLNEYFYSLDHPQRVAIMDALLVEHNIGKEIEDCLTPEQMEYLLEAVGAIKEKAAEWWAAHEENGEWSDCDGGEDEDAEEDEDEDDEDEEDEEVI